MASNVRAAPLGCLRSCSQPCSVRTDTPNSAANCDCDNPVFCRAALTGELTARVGQVILNLFPKYSAALKIQYYTPRATYTKRTSAVKVTEYFQATRLRPDRADIKDEWIITLCQFPSHQQTQPDGRIRRWGMIGNGWMRVVLLPDGETIHNAFFDRSFRL
jgi:hypothetical protein